MDRTNTENWSGWGTAAIKYASRLLVMFLYSCACNKQTNKGLRSWLYVVAHITLLWLWLFFPSIDLRRCLVYWKSILSGTQYVTLKKCFSHQSLVIYCFPTSPSKLKTGTANTWETTNSKPPRPIIMIGWSVTGNSSQIIFVTLFSGRC
jgi:hypothetical protein